MSNITNRTSDIFKRLEVRRRMGERCEVSGEMERKDVRF